MKTNHERAHRMKRAALANAGIAALSIAAKMADGSSIFASEASHSSSDALVHGARYGAELSEIDQQKGSFRAFISMSMLVPAGFLIHNATEAIVRITSNEQSMANPVVNGVGALAVLGCNYYAYRQVNSIENHSCASGASHTHARSDLLVSAGFTLGLLAEATQLPFSSEISNGTNAALSGIAAGNLLLEAIDTLLNNNHVDDDNDAFSERE